MLIKVASSMSYKLDILVVGAFKGIHTLARYYLIWEIIPIMNNSGVEKFCIGC